jgi:stalled ribosome rescue protein Dom34
MSTFSFGYNKNTFNKFLLVLYISVRNIEYHKQTNYLHLFAAYKYLLDIKMT